MSSTDIYSEIQTTISEMAKEKNMSQEAAEKVIKKIIEILEMKKPNFEEKLADLEVQIRSIETNYINLGITHAAQTLKYKKLLKENLALRKRIEILEKESARDIPFS